MCARGIILTVLRKFSSASNLPSVASDPQSVPRHRATVERGEELLSQAEKNRVKVKEVVHQFQCQPGDTGSTPVQIAVLTFKIKHLNQHLKRNRKDYSCQRSLVKMVHHRRKLLQYLERTDHLSYLSVLSELQLRTPKTQ